MGTKQSNIILRAVIDNHITDYPDNATNDEILNLLHEGSDLISQADFFTDWHEPALVSHIKSIVSTIERELQTAFARIANDSSLEILSIRKDDNNCYIAGYSGDKDSETYILADKCTLAEAVNQSLQLWSLSENEILINITNY